MRWRKRREVYNSTHAHSPTLTLQWPSVPTPAAVPSEPWQKSPEVVPLLVPESAHQRSEREGRQKKRGGREGGEGEKEREEKVRAETEREDGRRAEKGTEGGMECESEPS